MSQKNEDTLLLGRLQTIEKQFWANARYSKKECLKISAIPLLFDKDLKDVVCKSITKACVEMSDNDFEVTKLIKGSDQC